MRKLNRFMALGLMALFFMATSCETQSDLPSFAYEVKEYHGQDYLDQYTTPDVMFHYAYISADGNGYSGWLIDNEGNIRSYTFDYPIIDYQDPIVSVAEISNLREKAIPTGKKADVDDLVEMFKTVNDIAKGKTELLESDPEAPVNSFVYAYSFTMNPNSEVCEDGCGPVSATHSGLLAQILIKAEGRDAKMNNTNLAEALIAWLEEVAKS